MDRGFCERCGERCELAHNWADLVHGKCYPMKEGKELMVKEEAEYQFTMTVCGLAAMWLIIGATWAAISQLSFPLIECVLLSWTFWVWGILSLFVFTPFALYRADRFGVFEE